MVMSTHPLVQIDSLTHRYGERVAIDSLSLAVDRATLFALLGPNGSGKSTLFKILATVLTPTSGSANVGGADVVLDRQRVRRRIGIVFQSPSLDGRLSVMENLLHQGHLYGLYGRALRSRSEELLDRFGLLSRSRDYVRTLSGGLQRRVELAKAILHRPEVLILDEPSTGLDPGARADLMTFLEEIRTQDGVTSLITTHLTEEADRCDRVAVLDHGKRIAFDSPATLKASLRCDIITVMTDHPSEFAKHAQERLGVDAKTVDGAVRIEKEAGHQFLPKLISAMPDQIQSVTVSKPTLGDVFLRLTGHSLRADEQEGSVK